MDETLHTATTTYKTDSEGKWVDRASYERLQASEERAWTLAEDLLYIYEKCPRIRKTWLKRFPRLANPSRFAPQEPIHDSSD